MFYTGQAYGEYSKAGRFINEGVLIATFLAVRGVEIPFWQMPLIYLAVMVIAALVGKFLVVIGIVKYNTRLANKENEDLMEILERLKNIEGRLK